MRWCVPHLYFLDNRVNSLIQKQRETELFSGEPCWDGESCVSLPVEVKMVPFPLWLQSFTSSFVAYWSAFAVDFS